MSYKLITTLYFVAMSIFIVECGIARFLCVMGVFEVRASFSISHPLG